jgi:hypothetical protein
MKWRRVDRGGQFEASHPQYFRGTEFNQRYERLLRRTVEERSSEKRALRHLRGEDSFSQPASFPADPNELAGRAVSCRAV